MTLDVGGVGVPNCDFYAFGLDVKVVLEKVFSAGDCDIYEMDSPFDRELKKFGSVSDLEEYYSVSDWMAGLSSTIHLQLLPYGAGGVFLKRRVSLDPEKCNGATFRYTAEGWGLVQLYLEAPRDGRLPPSHTNHNSEKRAWAWAELYPDIGSPSEWNWPLIRSYSNRINRFIRGSAVAQRGSLSVLPGAHAASQVGLILS